MLGLCPKQLMPIQRQLSDRNASLVVAINYQVQWMGSNSLADDLVTGQGVVFSRATSTLRSVETQPLVGRIVFPGSHVMSPLLLLGPAP